MQLDNVLCVCDISCIDGDVYYHLMWLQFLASPPKCSHTQHGTVAVYNVNGGRIASLLLLLVQA